MANPEPGISSSRRSGSVSWNSRRQSGLLRETFCAARVDDYRPRYHGHFLALCHYLLDERGGLPYCGFYLPF